MPAGGLASAARKAALFLVLAALALLWARGAAGQDSPIPPESLAGEERTAIVLDVQGPIGPATHDFLERSLESAAERNAALVVIRMDTPGGLDASTRDIIKDILSSTVPVATWVAPEGARAASAGTYIMLASHIAAMSPATNVGAATPVSLIGGSHKAPSPLPGIGKKPAAGEQDGANKETSDENAGETGDETAAAPEDAMTRKVINDAVAYIRGLADRRGRNADWAERAVREAVSVTSEEALELGVIDFIAADLGALLEQADGRTVETVDGEVTLATRGLATERIEPDWRNKLLAAITSPTIAYLLLLIGIYGLVLEGYHPGAVLPGVVGAICLLLALYALQMLPVNYVGLGLIVLGVILMIAEVMSPSFGALGFGGIIALVIGSIILIDIDAPGFGVSRPLIGSIALTASLGLMAILWVAMRARGRPVVSGREELVGARGTALESFEHEGHVHIHSERWSALAEAPVRAQQTVVVTGLDGLTLKVRPVSEATKEPEDV